MMFRIVFLVFVFLSDGFSQAQEIDCGCNDCTSNVLSTDARGQTCLQRIQTRIDGVGNTEEEACRTVASTYPIECGPSCHPDKCDGQAPPLCGCNDCTEEVWDAQVNGFSCGQRILLSMSSRSEEEACIRIAETYPDQCGPCNPDTCPSPAPTTAVPTPARPTDNNNNNTTTTAPIVNETAAPTIAPPEHCDCYECSMFWDNDAGGYTCGDRIEYEQTGPGGGYTEEEACRRQSERNPYTCGPGCHPDKCDDRAPAFCGCPDCTLDMLSTQAGDFTCAQRIASLRLPSGGNMTEVQACAKVATDFEECGVAEECNPNVCNGPSSLSGTTDQEREGAPWAWAVLGANALFCIIIFIMYRKW